MPARLGGLGLTDPGMLREEIKRSREVTQTPIKHLIKKDPTYSSEMKANQLQARKEVKAKKRKVILRRRPTYLHKPWTNNKNEQ